MATTKLTRTNEAAGKFTRGQNAGTFTCDVCGKRRQVANREIRSGTATGVCTDCFDVAGLENEHSDTDGDHNGQAPVHGCPDCESVIVAAAPKVVRNATAKVARKVSKTQAASAAAAKAVAAVIPCHGKWSKCGGANPAKAAPRWNICDACTKARAEAMGAAKAAPAAPAAEAPKPATTKRTRRPKRSVEDLLTATFPAGTEPYVGE